MENESDKQKGKPKKSKTENPENKMDTSKRISELKKMFEDYMEWQKKEKEMSETSEDEDVCELPLSPNYCFEWIIVPNYPDLIDDTDFSNQRSKVTDTEIHDKDTLCFKFFLN